MSRNTLRRKVRVNELTEELSIGAAMRLRTDSDSIRHVVDAVVAYLVEEYPAQDLYIPASVNDGTYPIGAIQAEVARGESMRSICRRFRIGRQTLYRLLGQAASNDC